MSPNITRRRVVQGVGAFGVAGVAGNALVSADETPNAVQEDQAAVRVVHASPDTPSVEVDLEGADDGSGDTGTPTDGDDPLIDGLEFGQVSSYREVDPGTYQLRIVAIESTGFLEGIFGDAEEQVVYDEEVELDAGTTYTAVAYGELAESDLGTEQTPGGATPEETPGVDEETPTDDEATPVGETEAPGVGEETPDTGEETPTEEGTPVGGETPGDGAETDEGEVLVEQLGYGEYESVELAAGDYTFEFRETEAVTDDVTGAETPTEDGVGAETETPTDAAGEDGAPVDDETPTDESPVVETETPTDMGTPTDDDADTPFRVELIEDDLSAPGDETGATTPGEETPTDGGVGAGEETPTDGEVGAGEETPTDGAGTSRIRIFNAVPDVDALEVVATEQEDGGLFGGGDSEETETPSPADAGIGGEETPTETPDGALDGEETPTGTPGGEDGVSVREADVSLEGGTAYSGFAIGYFDVAAADEGAATDTPTDGGIGAGEETPTEAPDGALDGEETPTGDAETTTAPGEEIIEDEREEFQFVTVETASNGERSDGGTDDGILPDRSAPRAPSD